VTVTAFTRAGRLLFALAALALVAVLGAAPATAHSVLLQTSPARGATVASAPDSVALTFNEMPQGEFSTIHVTGPDGQRRDNGHVQVVNDVVTEPLGGTRPAGRYVVDWRVVSADGHPVSGEFAFTARAAGLARVLEMPGKHAANSPVNTGTIIGIVAAAVVFGALFIFLLLRRKPAGHDSAVHE
jgi:methionine-rich copper-binding protein CopC